LYLIVIGRNSCNEEIANDTANGDDQGCSNVDEKFSGAMAYEKLSSASHH
jgi:hypothetical protein